LSVDRANERHNAEAAATTGVSPRIVEYLDDVSVMVLEFVEGETMSGQHLRRAGMTERIAGSLRRLHAGPAFLQDFDMFRLVEYYLLVAADRDIPVPAGFDRRAGEMAAIERAVRTNRLPMVPCHNDLMAQNYIDDGRQLWIIDFEYSGNNDPCFDLADTAIECEFDDAAAAELCRAYFARDDPVQLARMGLFAIMADLGWTLWAAIQSRVSTIEYDFWGWAVERWERADRALDRARLASLLEAA